MSNEFQVRFIFDNWETDNWKDEINAETNYTNFLTHLHNNYKLIPIHPRETKPPYSVYGFRSDDDKL
jgi:hypothetical protein